MNDDAELWRSLRRGDVKALEILFREYFDLLYDYGTKLTTQKELVKDCIQDLFIYIWEKQTTLSQVQSVKAYLLISLRRSVLKCIKQQQKQISEIENIKQQTERESFSPEEMLIVHEKESAQMKWLKSAIDQIPQRMREALYLKTYSEMPYKDIARIMGISPQVARNYVSEAFQKLRESLERSD